MYTVFFDNICYRRSADMLQRNPYLCQKNPRFSSNPNHGHGYRTQSQVFLHWWPWRDDFSIIIAEVGSLTLYMKHWLAVLQQKEHLFLFLLPALASYWLKDLADGMPTTRKHTNKMPLTLRKAPAASQSSLSKINYTSLVIRRDRQK